MFGWFGSGKKTQQSVTAPELGTQLQKQDALPAKLPPAAQAKFAACEQVYMRGNPPQAQWTQQEVQGETRRVFRLPAHGAQPELALFASTDSPKRTQLWELDGGGKFSRQRKLNWDTAQGKWVMDYPLAVACLPDGQAAVALAWHDPRPKQALYLYNPAQNQARLISVIEPDMSSGPPFKAFESMTAGADALLVLFHTDLLRLGASNYAWQFDHIWLFSKRFPQGLPVLKLSVDDGNVHSWAMQGNTLWLQTRDKRKKGQEFIWSLDLSKAL